MSYSCTLYNNTSHPNAIHKQIGALATVSCDFKNMIDVENPEVYIAATDAYDKAKSMSIPEFGSYYFCKAKAGTGQTITYECVSDPLMSFQSAILSSPAVIARNPWHFDMYIPDPKYPIEARTMTATLKFPDNQSAFNGTNNKYILTTIGNGPY